ncbi:MAG: hypothetical protein GX270_06690, partial [Clostridiaceae bacterium]|nr:hypothetical protein [Clostridiaceae bacterium]
MKGQMIVVKNKRFVSIVILITLGIAVTGVYAAGRIYTNKSLDDLKGYVDNSNLNIQVVELPQGKDIEKVFQSEVLKMLKKEGKINQFIIDNMLSWENTGF